MIHNWSNVPGELRDRPQWVTWERDRTSRKLPFGADGLADTTDPGTWLSFAAASRLVRRRGHGGLGFVFSPDDPYVGIDLDACASGPQSRLMDWARDIVQALRSYTERSPSGTGVHVIVRAEGLPRNVRHKTSVQTGGAIELYDRARYFTVTGVVYGGYGRIRRCPRALARVITDRALVHAQMPAEGLAPVRLGHLSDDQVVAAMCANDPREYRALFVRGAQDGDDRSQLDFRLACLITRYVGGDSERVARLMRRSALVREKWDRPGYLNRYTIPKAAAATDTFVIVRKGAA